MEPADQEMALHYTVSTTNEQDSKSEEVRGHGDQGREEEEEEEEEASKHRTRLAAKRERREQKARMRTDGLSHVSSLEPLMYGRETMEQALMRHERGDQFVMHRPPQTMQQAVGRTVGTAQSTWRFFNNNRTYIALAAILALSAITAALIRRFMQTHHLPPVPIDLALEPNANAQPLSMTITAPQEARDVFVSMIVPFERVEKYANVAMQTRMHALQAHRAALAVYDCAIKSALPSELTIAIGIVAEGAYLESIQSEINAQLKIVFGEGEFLESHVRVLAYDASEYKSFAAVKFAHVTRQYRAQRYFLVTSPELVLQNNWDQVVRYLSDGHAIRTLFCVRPRLLSELDLPNNTCLEDLGLQPLYRGDSHALLLQREYDGKEIYYAGCFARVSDQPHGPMLVQAKTPKMLLFPRFDTTAMKQTFGGDDMLFANTTHPGQSVTTAWWSGACYFGLGASAFLFEDVRLNLAKDIVDYCTSRLAHHCGFSLRTPNVAFAAILELTSEPDTSCFAHGYLDAMRVASTYACDQVLKTESISVWNKDQLNAWLPWMAPADNDNTIDNNRTLMDFESFCGVSVIHGVCTTHAQWGFVSDPNVLSWDLAVHTLYGGERNLSLLIVASNGSNTKEVASKKKYSDTWTPSIGSQLSDSQLLLEPDHENLNNWAAERVRGEHGLQQQGTFRQMTIPN